MNWTDETSQAVAGLQDEWDIYDEEVCTEDCLGDDAIDAGPQQYDEYD